MKRGIESANFVIVSIICMLILSGCADTKWPSWLTGEPDDTVLNAPRIIGKPKSLNNETWPNLADVPSKPKNATTVEEGKKQIQQMNEDKADAKELRMQIIKNPPIIATPLPYIRP